MAKVLDNIYKGLYRGSGILLFGAITACTQPKWPEPKLLVSKWEEGSCSFLDNKLTYTVNGKTASIELDYKIQHAELLVCSTDFSVVLSDRKVVVSLGGRKILNDWTSLRQMGNFGFLAVNSYAAELPGEMGGIIGIGIAGNKMLVNAKNGSWKTELIEPDSTWKPSK